MSYEYKCFLIGAVLGAMLGAGSAYQMNKRAEEPEQDDYSNVYKECVRYCEQTEPDDRGQGCIDIVCNPMLEENS